MTVRPFRDEDRRQVLALLGDARAIDSASSRLHVALEGGVEGVSLWIRPAAGDTPLLGAVTLKDPDRFDLLYQLAAAACQDAIASGFTRGHFEVQQPALLRRLRRDFTIDPQPSGWHPVTGQPVQWDVEVDLQDALQQLQSLP